MSVSDAEQTHLRAAMACLDEFTSRIGQGLENADCATRREILRLLIERIYVEPEQVRIVYRISFPLFLQTPQTTSGNTPSERILHFCCRSGPGLRVGDVELAVYAQRHCCLPLDTTRSASQRTDFGAQYTAWSFPCERFALTVAHQDASLGAKAIG